MCVEPHFSHRSGSTLRHGRVPAVRAVPGRDAVSPPQLPADAPVADVLEPVVVHLREALRDDLDPARAHGFQPHIGHRLHLHEPLRAHHRLDDLAARAASGAPASGTVLGLDGQPRGFHVGPQLLARLEAVHARVGPAGRVHLRVLVEHADDLQAVALPDLEVVRVVAGRDLQRARAELHVHVGVVDHRDRPLEDGHQAGRADQVAIALVVGMHGHGGVAQDRLRPRRGHRDVALARPILQVRARDRVLEVVEGGVLLGVLHLQVADRGLQARATS